MRFSCNCLVWLGGLVLAGALARPQAAPPASSAPPVPLPQVSPPLVLTSGTVVDVTNWGNSANDLHNAVVIVRGNTITQVGAAGTVTVPKDAQIIDCTGKYIIPGLVDGFAGMSSQGQANANLYMGVTTVVARQDSERGLIDLNAHPSPHIFLIDSVGTTDNGSLLAKQPEWAATLREGAHPVELSPEDMARQIAATARLGTRVLFLGPDLTAANVQWIIARAHQMGLATYGEFVATPYQVGVEADVDALVHMGRYELGVIPDELREPLASNPYGQPASAAYDYAQRIPSANPQLRAYAHFLAAHHAALMPTFSLYYLQLPAHSNLWKEPAAALLDASHMYDPSNPATGEMVYPLPPWARHLPGMAQRWMEGNLQKKADQAAMRLWLINQTIFSAFPHYLAGSGASSTGTMAGISLHTELELLVRLGLSPREALASATNNYALQFGWTELGQIAPGRRADILVLDGDPTVNIWNTRLISTLILNGNVIDRGSLLQLKK